MREHLVKAPGGANDRAPLDPPSRSMLATRPMRPRYSGIASALARTQSPTSNSVRGIRHQQSSCRKAECMTRPTLDHSDTATLRKTSPYNQPIIQPTEGLARSFCRKEHASIAREC